MTAFTVLSLKWSFLAIIVVFGFVIDRNSVSSLEVAQPTGTNRVLPVDAEHKSKISVPRINPGCIQNLRENLVKFLKKVKKDGVRKGKQDDGDDGDDGEEGIAGVLAGLGEGNGALSTLQALPAVLPSLVQSLTQFSGAINMGLNGTDTPNIPSFLVRQGMEAVKFFQAIAGAAQQNRVPSEAHVQRIPGEPIPMRKPRPPTPGYEQYPGTDTDDYTDEDVRQPLQPTLRPLRPEYGGNDAGLGQRPNYEPYPGGNPFLENADLRQPGYGTTPSPNEETLNGLPPKTSLWQIYKSFRNKSPGNGTLSDFQLAHPDAFSNELLQSISNSISSVRGQTANQVIPTDKPSSEIFKQFYPENKQPAVFNSPNRPTLSVYKPSASTGGIGIDLSNLALNASLSKLMEQQTASSENVEETTLPASLQEELESESGAAPDGEKGQNSQIVNQKPEVNADTNHGTGSFSELQAQAKPQEQNSNAPQFVKSPTSSLLTLQMGEYVPAVSSLHPEEEKIGPQVNSEDHFNGFRNKAPYEAVKNVLIVAPRLTPSPLYSPKPPSGLTISDSLETTTLTPEFAYEFQSSNSKGSSGISSLYPPDAQHSRPVDPNSLRSPTVSAAIPSRFQLPLPHNPYQTNGFIPPFLLPQYTNPVPDSDIRNGSTTEDNSPSTEVNESIESSTLPPEPQEDVATPEGTRKTTSSQSKTSVLASSLLSNIAELSAVKQTSSVSSFSLKSTTENYVDENKPNNLEKGVPSFESPFTSNLMNSLNRPTNAQNNKLFQHFIGNLNLPQLLQNPAVLQSLLINQALVNRNTGLGTTESLKTLISSTPEAKTISADVNFQEDIVSSTLTSIVTDEKSSTQNAFPNFQNSGSLINRYPSFPSAPQKLTSSSANAPAPAIIAGIKDVNSQLLNNINQFPHSLQSSEPSNNPSQPNNSGIKGAPSVESQFQSNGLPFQHSPNLVSTITETSSDEFLSTTANALNVASNGSFIGNNFYPVLNIAPPLRFPEPIQSVGHESTSNKPEKLTEHTWGTHTGNKDANIAPVIAASHINIGGSSNSNQNQNAQSQVGGFPQFSNTLGFVPDQNNILTIPADPATISESTTEKEINLSQINLNYQNLNGFPESVLSVPDSGVVSSSVQSQPSSQSNSLLIGGTGFQGPIQNTGYPSFVPITSSSGGSAISQQPIYGGSFSAIGQSENTTLTNDVNNSLAPTDSHNDTGKPDLIGSTLSQQQSIPSQSQSLDPQQSLGEGSFSQKLASKLVGTSAIAEMSKLPFFQEDSFRPSALPPYLSSNQKEEDSYEQTDLETEKPISELFSSTVNVSKPEEVALNASTLSPGPSVTLEEDSYELPYPNFPPGKPVFWMNMYYPNGLPVLMKVSTTTPSTTIKPRKKRRRTTTLATTTIPSTLVPDSEYYEDDDVTKKRKRKTDVDFVS